MGVGFGKLLPNSAYSTIRRECISNHSDLSALRLSVRTKADLELQCAGVAILDSSDDSIVPELNVLGVQHPPYEELFPDHVSRYEKQFR